MTAAIEIDDIAKSYRISQSRQNYLMLRDVIMEAVAAPLRHLRAGAALGKTEEFWALKGVSLRVEPGEVVGLIGRNGSGKTTLLKILSRITPPSRGRAKIHGRVGSLLEVGTGFHQELTGRENIYLNGAHLGMKRSEIQKKYDAIVDFSGISQFIDTPVKRYSSGMKVRLAFAVAAHLEPEILLIDEVLAVGDFDFQRRCLRKMKDVVDSGRTIIFVSHDMAAVRALCKRTVLLENGTLKASGPSDQIISQYLAAVPGTDGNEAGACLRQRNDRQGYADLHATAVRVFPQGTAPNTPVSVGDDTVFELEFENRTGEPMNNLIAEILIFDDFQRLATTLQSDTGGEFLQCGTEGGMFRCVLPKLPLSPGNYTMNVTLRRHYMGHRSRLLDTIESAATFHVNRGDFYGTGKLPTHRCGSIFLPQHWSSEGLEAYERSA